MFFSGSFTSSTPIPKQHDSGFYENSLLSENLLQTSKENLAIDSSCMLLRRNLFGKRRISENIPVNQFSDKRKLFSRNSTFSYTDATLNKETPRASRRCAVSNKSLHFTETKTLKRSQRRFINCNTPPLHQFNYHGFHNETPKRSECYGIPLLPLIEKWHQRIENLNEESLVYFKSFFGDKNCADLSTSEMLRLYLIYRYQRTGFKPFAPEIAFNENHQLMNEESYSCLLSWKEKLECISEDLYKRPKIDFLSELHKMNALFIVSNILSYLSGYNLQNASCVSKFWRKLVLGDKAANMARWAYLKEKQQFMKEKKKLPHRTPNFKILGSIENVKKEQLQLEKTIKEINFNAFIEVGKGCEKNKAKKCPSCFKLSLQDKQVITKYNCFFCGYEFCYNCLIPYTNWHLCTSTYLPTEKPPANRKKYLRRL